MEYFLFLLLYRILKSCPINNVDQNGKVEVPIKYTSSFITWRINANDDRIKQYFSCTIINKNF